MTGDSLAGVAVAGARVDARAAVAGTLLAQHADHALLVLPAVLALVLSQQPTCMFGGVS